MGLLAFSQHTKYMIHNATAHIGPAPITIETGKLARLADGAVTVRSGETIVLVSAVSATTVKEGQDWFPLTVDYREKAAAVGKFPGGYFKREGRPTEKEILTARMTDRPLRPLFPKGYLYDTQIIGTVMSADGRRAEVYLKQRSGNLSSDRVLLGTLNDAIFFDQNPPAKAIADDGRIHFVFALNASVWYGRDDGGRMQPGAHWIMGVGLL